MSAYLFGFSGYDSPAHFLQNKFSQYCASVLSVEGVESYTGLTTLCIALGRDVEDDKDEDPVKWNDMQVK